MDKTACSEAHLCAYCLAFVKAISSRSRSFPATALSEYKGPGLWPPSATCHICKMINSANPEEFALTSEDHEMFESGPTFISHSHRNDMVAYGGQGPLSKVEICTNRGTNGLSVTFAIWCDDDTLDIVQDPPLPSDNCPEAFALVTKWLRTCRFHHRRCLKTRSGLIIDEIHGPKLPTRVLDVSKRDEGVVSLIESNGLKGNFCALSYCWGKGPQSVVTTRETIADHCAGIEIGLLPQTFKDAIQLTSEIGINYLWIDSLCIIQDDDGDWEKEAADMANVYQHAFLVIAADGASHSNGGCFVRRDVYPSGVELPFYDASGQICSSFWLSRQMEEDSDEYPESGPLQQRAWALQETYLARRSVHFMPGGMSWSCQCMSLGERTWMHQDTFQYDWYDVLGNYSRCKLTYKKDRLSAIKGLARVFEEEKGVGYHMGILDVDIEEQLLWILEGFASPSDTLDDVPSWSWASQGGPKSFAIRIVAGGQRASETTMNLVMEPNEVIRFTGNLGKCDIHEDFLTFDDSDREASEEEDREASEEEDGEASEEEDGEASEEEDGEVLEDPHELYASLLAWFLDDFCEGHEYQIMYGEDPTSQPIGFAVTDEPYVGSCYTAFLWEIEWDTISALSNEYKIQLPH
uniref:Heterokaryon incompatibility domain-containing protein n=1 Tax=Bionectria ochroleuca TaxID=29856 RepID=A0A0B7JTU5_BIOOC